MFVPKAGTMSASNYSAVRNRGSGAIAPGLHTRPLSPCEQPLFTHLQLSSAAVNEWV